MKLKLQKGEKSSIQKLGGYTVSLNHENLELINAASKVIASAKAKGYESLLQEQN